MKAVRFKQQCNKGHYFLNLTFSTQLLYMMSVVWQLWLCNYTVWKLYHCRLLEGEDSLQLTTELLDGKVYQSLIDFDNHLDDITQDWLNKDINKVVDISPTAWIYCLVLLIFSESMTRVKVLSLFNVTVIYNPKQFFVLIYVVSQNAFF